MSNENLSVCSVSKPEQMVMSIVSLGLNSTHQSVVWPYGCSHKAEPHYSSILLLPAYIYFPQKALLQENACLENCTVCREAETELP